MLEMRTIKKVSQHKDQHAQNQFLSILFLVRKKDEGSHPVMNLKTLNQFVPFMHFKMENLHTLKYMMKERDYMCKIYLKDTYFTAPPDKSCHDLVRTSPSSFYQNFESSNIPFAPSKYQILIYLDNISQSIERLLVARDTIIFLLQHLGFVINFKKSVMEPVQTTEYLVKNRVFSSCDKFHSNDSFLNRRENERSFTGMQNNIFNERDNSFAVTTISKSSIIHDTSSSSS